MKIYPIYKHIVQKNALCGAACLQMILFRRGLWVEQEQLAIELETKVPEKYAHEFYLPIPVAKNAGEEGTAIGAFVGSEIKRIFKKYKLKLKSKIYYVDEIKDAEEFIRNNLANGNDMIFNFSSTLFDSSSKYGHYSLVAEILDKEVVFVDPKSENKSFRKVSLELLLEKTNTIDSKGVRRGIVVFYE